MSPASYPARLVIAISAEAVYFAGRTLVRPAFTDAIAGELAVTAWRLPFVVLYLWLFMDTVRNSATRRGMPWHPLLLVVIAVDLVSMTFWNPDTELAARLVFAMTTPIVALREELFYRAILQNALEKPLGSLGAILAASVIFVASHIGAQPMNVVTITSIAAAGVLLGAIYQRTRNLWIVVVLHTLDDVFALIPWNLAGGLVVLCSLQVLIWTMVWWAIDRAKSGSAK